MTADPASGVPHVTMHVWRVPPRQVPVAFWRMAADRAPLRRVPGLRFAKLLGTGDGRTFTLRDADVRRWALLVSWEDPSYAERFEQHSVTRAWDALSEERLRVTMRPIASRGTWSRREPFGRPVPEPWTGPVAAVTRARIDPRRMTVFWRAVPPVSADLRRSAGLRLAVGVGEAPVGTQGTFSVWESAAAMVDFAHHRAAHQSVVARTHEIGWYVEELFARFAVLDVAGSFDGRTP